METQDKTEQPTKQGTEKTAATPISPKLIERRIKASPLCNYLKELYAPKSSLST